MANDDDIRLLVEQEKALVLPEFSEAIAFALGSALRAAALAGGYGIVADVRSWERPLFYMALPGTGSRGLSHPCCRTSKPSSEARYCRCGSDCSGASASDWLANRLDNNIDATVGEYVLGATV